jgi:hypothetical protein
VVDAPSAPGAAPALAVADGRIVATCGGGGTLAVRTLELDGTVVDAVRFLARFGAGPVPLASAGPR